MYRLFLRLEGLPKTTNANGRTHWSHKMREAKKWRSLTALHASKQRPEKPLEKAEVVFTRYSAQSPDFDGLVSSFKHLQDGLIDAGIIVNDTMEVLKSTYKWSKAPIRNGYVTIELFELNGGKDGNEDEKIYEEIQIN